MVLHARDLPAARLRRWGYNGLVTVLAVIACWSAVGAWSRARELAEELEVARNSLDQHLLAADRIASECGLEPFSDEESLERFPVTLPPFPTRSEMECARRVGVARSDLIEDHLKIDRTGPLLVETRDASRTRAILAGGMALVWALGIYITEIHPRRRARAA